MEMTPRMELAALEGWANNKAIPLEERFQTALQVIKKLNELLNESVYVLEKLQEAHKAWNHGACPQFCPYDCDNCHSDECPCDRSGCAGSQ